MINLLTIVGITQEAHTSKRSVGGSSSHVSGIDDILVEDYNNGIPQGLISQWFKNKWNIYNTVNGRLIELLQPAYKHKTDILKARDESIEKITDGDDDLWTLINNNYKL